MPILTWKNVLNLNSGQFAFAVHAGNLAALQYTSQLVEQMMIVSKQAILAQLHELLCQKL